TKQKKSAHAIFLYLSWVMNDRKNMMRPEEIYQRIEAKNWRHVVLAVNPDGCQLGLRANANGIDLNRNFPAANWKAGETVYRW
ncbi:DUF2817 domain-containing protein, partial [Salmonella enterica subsp. enterica serovar Montevideo]|nr:DUF2817 domain-containing protein [Salmonella enterica subsp. enterica serovar Montevideo]